MSQAKQTKRPHKDERYLERCFPSSADEVFKPSKAGYAPLPYLSRELLRHLEGSELKVWIYLLTRGGPQSICYPTYEDMMQATGVTKGTISKAIHRLEKIGLIRSHNDAGTRRYLLRDPRLAVQRLFELKEMTLDQLEEANDLLDRIGRPLIDPKTVLQKAVKKQSKEKSDHGV